MKPTLLLIILFSVVNLTAQSYDQNYQNLVKIRNEKNTDPYVIIGLYTTSILLNAFGEALNDKGHLEAGHICNALSVVPLVTLPLLTKHIYKDEWFNYLLSYLFLRIALYDVSYNAMYGHELSYLSNSNAWDRSLKKWGAESNDFLFVRGVSLLAGVAIPINSLGKNRPFYK